MSPTVLHDHVQARSSRCDGPDPGDVEVLRSSGPFKTSALSSRHGEQQLIIFPPGQRERDRVLFSRFRIGAARRRDGQGGQTDFRADAAFFADVSEIAGEPI